MQYNGLSGSHNLFDAKLDVKKRCRTWHRPIRSVSTRCYSSIVFYRDVWRQKAWMTNSHHYIMCRNFPQRVYSIIRCKVFCARKFVQKLSQKWHQVTHLKSLRLEKASPLFLKLLLKQEYHRKDRPFPLSYNSLNNLPPQEQSS